MHLTNTGGKGKQREQEPQRVRNVERAKLTALFAWGLPLLALGIGFAYHIMAFVGLPRALTIVWSEYGSFLLIVVLITLEFTKPKNKRRLF